MAFRLRGKMIDITYTNTKTYKLLSWVLLVVTIITLVVLPVYADVSIPEGVDWSQEYFYNRLGDVLQETDPDLESWYMDIDWFLQMAEMGQLTQGFVRPGFRNDGNLTENLGTIYIRMTEQINNGQANISDYGSVYLYKGKPYYADLMGSRYYRLTPEMERELNDNAIKNSLLPLSSGNSALATALARKINRDTVKTLLYYGLQPPSALLNDLISLFSGGPWSFNEAPGEEGPYIGKVEGLKVCWGTNIPGVTTGACWANEFESISITGLSGKHTTKFYGTCESTDSQGRISRTPLYFRIVANGKYYVTNKGTGRFTYQWNLMSPAFSYPKSDDYGWIIGTYGSPKASMRLPHIRRRRGVVSPNCIYDNAPVNDAVKDIDDDAMNNWNDNPLG